MFYAVLAKRKWGSVQYWLVLPKRKWGSVQYWLVAWIICIYVHVLHSAHCANNNQNLRIKTKPVSAEADVRVAIWLLLFIFLRQRNLSYLMYRCICSNHIGLDFMPRFRLFLGQCTFLLNTHILYGFDNNVPRIIVYLAP